MNIYIYIYSLTGTQYYILGNVGNAVSIDRVETWYSFLLINRN